jgi:hypothetical protein
MFTFVDLARAAAGLTFTFFCKLAGSLILSARVAPIGFQ